MPPTSTSLPQLPALISRGTSSILSSSLNSSSTKLAAKSSPLGRGFAPYEEGDAEDGDQATGSLPAVAPPGVARNQYEEIEGSGATAPEPIRVTRVKRKKPKSSSTKPSKGSKIIQE